tara:strand:- start:2880 stop:3887 length:1008 start_codon:yes stop_codon:yes gene_type:complete
MTVYQLFFIFFFFIINLLLIKNNFLLDKVDFSTHKKFIKKKKTPVTGGLLFLIYLFVFIEDYSLKELFIFILIFLIGFISDFYKNFKPLWRLILQIFPCLFFIWLSEINITNINIDYFDELLIEYNFLSILLTTFSIIVLMNGSNFTDGVNLSATGYFLGLFALFYFLGNQNYIMTNLFFIQKIIFILCIILIINAFNMTMLGDGGIYLISFITGFFVINLIDQNKIISPYFATLIFWYPCVENLFSIIRKKFINVKTIQADNFHLHQLIYAYFKKKIKSKHLNNLTGLSILLFNYLIFYLSFNFYNNTQILIIIIFVCILLYLFLYLYLYKHIK